MSRGLTFALEQLPPLMRKQAQEKLADAGTVRIHTLQDENDRITHVANKLGKGAKPEDLFALQMEANGIKFEREYRFHHERKWRFDFAILSRKVAVEIEGLLPGLGGRHQRIGGFEKDLEKYKEAWVLGWRVLRVSHRMVKRGEAIRTLCQGLS